MVPSQIDLNELANNEHLSVTITSNAEENPKDASMRRVKDITLFFLAIFFILAAFAFCVYIILSRSRTPSDKKWAMTVAGGIIAAFLGFLTGRNYQHKS